MWKRITWAMTLGAMMVVGMAWAGAYTHNRSMHGEDHARGRRHFAPKGTAPKYAPDRPFLIKHLRLELKVHPRKGKIEGQALLTMVANAKPIDEVTLHAAELSIKEVWVNTSKVTWQGEDHKLHIALGKTMAPKKPFVVRVVYSATPRTGLHFVKLDKAYPKRPLMVFSQGETESNRFWFPSYDTTNMRFTSETLFTVPKPMMVVTNGRLLRKTDEGKFVTYHHKMKENHVNYLVAVAIGVFKVYKQSWKGIPIRSLVPPEDFDKAKRSFENTADMMEFFSESIGFAYPYSKYDQVVVHRFVAGGMENITATILTHATLHDARAHLDERSDGLVAHELAHQWFGDLLTCKSWSHIWLNESFATYFDKLYVEHKWGQEEFDSQRHRMLGWYWRSSYRRPIQTNVYQFPGDMFDAHSYPKGAAVLHMIRTILGDRLWWDAINHYVTTNAHGLVETSDLRRALEETSGRNWKPFFDQWVRRAGHPVFRFSWRYDAKNKLAVVTLRQKQKHLYRFPTTLTATFAKAKPTTRATTRPATQKTDDADAFRRQVIQVDVSKKVQTITIPAPTRPKLVEFDPREHILKQVKAKKSWQEWVFQVQHGSAMLSRARAAKALGKFPNRPTVHKALVGVLMDESLHHTLRRAAAHALGKLSRDNDCRALLTGAAVSDSKVRTVVAEQLGRCSAHKPLGVLVKLMRTDPSYRVRAAAVKSIAKLRHKRSFDLMKEAYKQTYRLGRIRIAALSGMIALEDERALAYLKKSIARGNQRRVRLFSLPSYARMVQFFREKKDKDDMLLLVKQLKDPDPFVRGTTVRALGVLGDSRAISHLRRFAEQAPNKSTARSVLRAIHSIVKQESLKKRLRKLGQGLEELRKLQRKMQRRFEKVERLKKRKQ